MTMRTRWFTIAMLLCLLASTGLGQPAPMSKAKLRPVPGAEITAEDRAVWEAVLRKNFPDDSRLMVYQERLTDNLTHFQDEDAAHPVSPEDAFKTYLAHELANANTAAVNDMMRRNGVLAKLHGPIMAGRKQEFLSRERSEAIFNRKTSEGKGWWPYFYELYPNSYGIIMLGLPGYDASHTQAIVYMGNQSQGLAGGGGYYTLRKKDGKWEVTGQVMSWIS